MRRLEYQASLRLMATIQTSGDWGGSATGHDCSERLVRGLLANPNALSTDNRFSLSARTSIIKQRDRRELIISESAVRAHTHTLSLSFS